MLRNTSEKTEIEELVGTGGESHSVSLDRMGRTRGLALKTVSRLESHNPPSASPDGVARQDKVHHDTAQGFARRNS